MKDSKSGMRADKEQRHRAALPEIRSFMEQHYAEPLTVGQLASMAGISPKYFVDLFTKTYGQSAIDFLTDIRMNRAKKYLTETNYRLREVAQKVGYSDEFYFSRKFKKEVGVSPSEFVRHPRKRIAVCSPSLIGYLLALKIVPVAAPLDSKWTPYYYNVYQMNIQAHLGYGTGQRMEDLNKLVKVRPDAIIGYEHIQEELRQKLADIATALFVPQQANWREQLRRMASFTDCMPQAEAWIDYYEQKLVLAREQIKQTVQEQTFVVLRVYGKGLHAYCNRSIEEVLYRELELNAAYTCEGIYNDAISLKELRRLNPDRVLVLVCPEMESRAYWLSLQHNEEWKALTAVRQGSVYLVPSDPWFEYSAVAVDRMLDEMQMLLTGYCPNADMDKVHGARAAHPL